MLWFGHFTSLASVAANRPNYNNYAENMSDIASASGQIQSINMDNVILHKSKGSTTILAYVYVNLKELFIVYPIIKSKLSCEYSVIYLKYCDTAWCDV